MTIQQAQHALRAGDRVGLARSATDAHTLGLASVASLLEGCGVACAKAPAAIGRAIETLNGESSRTALLGWIREERLSALGFSHRLDPRDGLRLFASLQRFLRESRLLAADGGPIRALYFGGLPETCRLVEREFPGAAVLFQGDEDGPETLARLGIDRRSVPAEWNAGLAYDESRRAFAAELLRRGGHGSIGPAARDFPGFGGPRERLEDRLLHGMARGLPPLMRVHVGPYTGDPVEDYRRFLAWTRRLAAGGLVDVLSIGSSQLTQSHFFRERAGLPDGGGVSVAGPEEYERIWRAARPMLVRTYAGSRDLERLAAMYDRTLNMAWHTLSFWWFNQLDGRGPAGLRDSLDEHFATLARVAAAGRPFEPNVPHHFAFRGGDDLSYVVSGVLAARAAKRAGVRTLVLQVMLNTPKATWGIQDLAKAQTLTYLARELEDRNFRVYLQPRGGLDYFSPDLEKAKRQLAEVSALMDDIEPADAASPPIVHVVSYSEARQLADPDIVEESVRITRHALAEYRAAKRRGALADPAVDPELQFRRDALLAEARLMLAALEADIPDLYSPAGFHRALADGYLLAPQLWAGREELPGAVAWDTRLDAGGVAAVDADGRRLGAAERIAQIRAAAFARRAARG